MLCCRWLTNTNRVEPLSTNITGKTPTDARQSIQILVSKTSVPNEKILECVIKTDPLQTNIDQNMAQ